MRPAWFLALAILLAPQFAEAMPPGEGDGPPQIVQPNDAQAPDTSQSDQDRPSDADLEAADKTGDPNGRLLTPQQEGRRGMIHGIAEQPFRDFNVLRSKIPPVLLEAIADPYERPSPVTCATLAEQIHVLNDALGPDFDEPVSTEHPGLVTRGESAAKVGAIDALRSGVQDYIPFDGFIRVLSGAERHDRLVLAAIQAGAVRRGYLKGLGEAHQCPPPAVPLHLAHPAWTAGAQNGPPVH